jgi:tRNA pseudouridine55 synthase
VYDFKSGEVLLLDKPLNWTSFDVVNRLRWKLRKVYAVKKFKVGHAGTLDPLATGLLIICTGKMTKESEKFMAQEKTYTGTILLGKTTPSYDLETAFNATFPIDHIHADMLQQAAVSFLGEQLQTPPVFSAKKIDGKRAYESARKGIEVEMRKSLVHITRFEIDAQRFPEIDFEICCSKGTYIRSIAHDFGQRLDSGGTLIALRRTQSGDFSIKDARSVDFWLEEIDKVAHSTDAG